MPHCAASTLQLVLHSRQFGFELLYSRISHWLSPVQNPTRHYDPYLVHDNHFKNSDLTNGVSRVRLYASPSFRIASACVGYG